MEEAEKKTVCIKMNEVDWENLRVVHEYYRKFRGEDLKNGPLFKRLLSDKVSQINGKN